MKKSRILDNSSAPSKVLNLDETLHYAQANRVLLTYDDARIVDIWSPQHKLSQPFKRGVYKNREALGKQLKEGSTHLCHVPLHRPYWQQERCLMCVQLDNSLLSIIDEGEEQYAS